MERRKLQLDKNSLDMNKVMPWYDSGNWKKSFREASFAFAKQDGNTVRLLTSLLYCRESVCDLVRTQVRGVAKTNIDINRLRMVAWRRVSTNKNNVRKNIEVFRDQMAGGLCLINTIEKQYKWPLTKIYPLELTDSATYNSAFYYIVASKRWIKAPAMLSMFTLLLRIGTNERKFRFRSRVKSMKSFESVLEDMAQKSAYTEARYVDIHLQNWLLVLKNYNRLFSKRTIESLYHPVDGYLFQEGINALCDLDSKDKELRDTFEKIVDKAQSQ